tara:strand:- start:1351 stop:1581 length:231 start_codon:yes stop_codon:yes gene_type:complete
MDYMEFSTFVEGDKRADVVRSVGNPKDRDWGVRYYVNGQNIGIEWYKGHSEQYAENAAENFVHGIKTTVNNKIIKG